MKTLFKPFQRWMRSRPQREYEWRFLPGYWRIQRALRHLKFKADEFTFNRVRSLRQQREAASILRELVSLIAAQSIFAAGLVIALKLIERFLGSWIPTRIHFDPDIAVNLISTLTQVAGTFLGLYFTAVSVVASTVYARVPGNVRSVLMQEKVGNLYIRIVALLGATGVLLLGAASMGYSPGILNTLLVTGLGVLATLSFVGLGMRAFNFLDPAGLAGYLGSDLIRHIESATPRGFRWGDSSFQAHYQKEADSVLSTYRNLVDIACNEQHIHGNSLKKIAEGALTLLQLYSEEKLKIPTDSYWFERTNRHPEWLTSDYARLDTALKTMTPLAPEQVPDPLWLEIHIEGITSRAVRALIEAKELRAALKITYSWHQTLSVLGRNFAIEEAVSLLKSLRGSIAYQARRAKLDVSGGRDSLDETALTLALTDIYGLGLISILLGLTERLRTGTAANLSDSIAAIDWDAPQSIYSTTLPRAVIEELEAVRKGVEFEISVEGSAISPLWYQQQFSGAALGRFLDASLRALTAELEPTFTQEAQAMLNENRTLVGAAVIQRGLEACSKFASHIQTIRAAAADLEALRRTPDITWIEPKWDEYSAEVERVRQQLLVASANCTTSLAKLPRIEEFPDYFGQIYSILASECFQAMQSGNSALFEKIFPSFFDASLAARDRLLRSLKGRDSNTVILFSVEPLLDLLELSGYALVSSELDKKSYGQVVERVWDEFFARLKDPKSIVEFITSILSFRESQFGLMPRDILRTSWKQSFERRLRELGLIGDMFGDPRVTRTRHPSKIIRALVRPRVIVSDARHVFLVVYLSKRPEAAGIPLPQRSSSFATHWKKENEQPKKGAA